MCIFRTLPGGNLAPTNGLLTDIFSRVSAFALRPCQADASRLVSFQQMFLSDEARLICYYVEDVQTPDQHLHKKCFECIIMMLPKQCCLSILLARCACVFVYNKWLAFLARLMRSRVSSLFFLPFIFSEIFCLVSASTFLERTCARKLSLVACDFHPLRPGFLPVRAREPLLRTPR